jgi:hypothetical protein
MTWRDKRIEGHQVMQLRSLLFACAAISFTAIAHTGAQAQESCLNEYKAEVADMPNVSADLAATADQIKHVQQAGLDANRYIVDYGNSYVLLTVKFHDLAEKTASAHRAAGNCTRTVTPYRKMADVKMIYDHYGLNGLLPPEMERTDYLTVVRSGDTQQNGMFMPQAGTGVHDMAISGETTRMIRKPYCVFGACS